ncbi:MAG TPA: hypothetical protein VHC49_09995 [Mycobacteriales bacterium]|nr:hypothetical protein [Mycobacteriales bacterium]
MVIVAVLLIAIAVVLTAAAVTSNGHKVTFDLWNIVDTKVSVGVVFIAGMITTVIAVGGIALLVAALRRKRRARRERKEINRQQGQQVTAGDSDLLSGLPQIDLSNLPSADQTGKKTP